MTSSSNRFFKKPNFGTLIYFSHKESGRCEIGLKSQKLRFVKKEKKLLEWIVDKADKYCC